MNTIFDDFNGNIDLSIFKKDNTDEKTQLRRHYLSLVGLLEYVDIINGDLTGRKLPEGITKKTVMGIVAHSIGDLDTVAAMEIIRSFICHDSDICKPGTANNAIYTKIGNFEILVSGELEEDTIHLIDDQPTYRFGLAIQMDKKYEDAATWEVNGKDLGLVKDEMDSNDPSWPRAIYIYPAVKDNNIYLAGTHAEKLTVKIHYKGGAVETYIIQYDYPQLSNHIESNTDEQGIQGIQGVQGDDGIDGLQGIQGIQGELGLQGLQSAQGLQGTTDMNDEQNLQGVQG